VLERVAERLTLDRMRTPLGEALLISDEDHRLSALDWEDHAAPAASALWIEHFA